MSITATDLGILGDLAEALGLIDGGAFNEEWLSNPGEFLSRILADEDQRNALIRFADEVLTDGASTRQADGTSWVPIVQSNLPPLTVYAVLNDRAPDYVSIGVGVRVSSANPISNTEASVPLFRVAKENRAVASPFFLGTADAVVAFGTELTLDESAPAPGAAYLGGVGLQIKVATAAGGPAPQLILTLRQLQLPGGTAAHDLVLDAGNPQHLDEVLLPLLLGLVRSQAEALASGELSALAGLLGLRAAINVPPLPVEALATTGLAAVSDWLESIIATPLSRAAWLGHLAQLLHGTLTGDQVVFNVGAAQLLLSVRRETGPGGHARLIPSLRVQLPVNADVILRAEADLCAIDFGGSDNVALPRLALHLVLGHRPDGGAVILDEAGTTHVRVETVRVGFAIDSERRPTFVLAADRVTIGTHVYETLDLSTPDAIADVGGVLLGDVADEIVDQLGAVGNAARILLGFSPPTDHPTVPVLDVVAFLQDPLGAVTAHWQTVVHDHAEAIPSLVATFRDLVGDTAAVGATGGGTGAIDDPWQVPLASAVMLEAWHSGDRLSIGFSFRFMTDTLGARRYRIESALRVAAVELDLAARSATFMPAVTGSIAIRARGRPQAVVATPSFVLTADNIGLAIKWTATAGVSAEFRAPNLEIDFGEGALPVPIPALDEGGNVTLSEQEWNQLEQVLGGLATAAGPSWLRDLAGALGWSRRQETSVLRAKLSLSLLFADPEAAFTTWLQDLALKDSSLLRQGLSVLSTIINGTPAGIAGPVEGEGRPDNPWQLPLSRAPDAIRLAVWIGPAGPPDNVSAAATALQSWRPGSPGLDATTLAAALDQEKRSSEDLAALVSGRQNLVAGFDALVVRWAGTDGRIVPPMTDPPGLITHRWPDLTARHLPHGFNVAEMLDRESANTVYVAVAPANASPWPDILPEHVIDLTTPGLVPAAFTLPTPAAGNWYIALGGRNAARLSTGDPNGVAGQTERLRRALDSLGHLPGGLVIVAEAAAGHAARRAAEAVAAVSDLILLGTPLDPVSFSVLDTAPAADTLRFLSALLPSDTDEISDDPDLALARGLIGGLMELLGREDPAQELQPPPGVLDPPRAGLNVHAVFGVVTEEGVRRALTAVVAAGVAERAQARSAVAAPPPNTLTFALRAPIFDGTASSGDVALDAYAQFEIATLSRNGTGLHIAPDRTLELHAGLGRPDAWLVGGPDPGHAVGTRSAQELRRLSLDVKLPLRGIGAASAALTLHEPRAFGVARERWVVQPSHSPVPPGVDAATPVLPEVRALLSCAAETLDTASGRAGNFAAALRAIGLLAAGGGTLPDAVDYFLHDPATHLAAVLADGTKRARLVTALRGLFPGAAGLTSDDLAVTLGPVQFHANLLTRRCSLTGGAAPGAFGIFSWNGEFVYDGAGSVTGRIALGATGATAAGGVELELSAAPPGISILWHRASLMIPERIALWPLPDANALSHLAARIVPAELARLALEVLRAVDETAQPVIDGALDAIGLLAPVGTGGARRVLMPAGLFADAAAWFRHQTALGGATGFSTARFIALADALKPLLDVSGGPGEWVLTAGVSIRLEAGAGGSPRFSVQIDSSAFAVTAASAGRLNFGAVVSLLLPEGARPRPEAELFIGLEGATAGRQALHVVASQDLRVFIRPETGTDIALYPTSAGLGQFAQSAITHALPLILDRLAAMSGNAGMSGQVGTVVLQLGNALGMRSGGAFSPTALAEWAVDPAATLTARLGRFGNLQLQNIAAALSPLIPGATGVDLFGGALEIHAGDITVRLQPSPLELTISGNVTGLPTLHAAQFSIGLNPAGLSAFDLEIGPADIDVGGISLHPFAGVHVGIAPIGGRRVELSLGLGDNRRIGARWLIGNRMDLVVVDSGIEHTDASEIALALLDAVLDIVAVFVLRTPALTTALAKPVGTQTVRQILAGVLLDPAHPTNLDAALFDPARLLERLQTLASNLAQAGPSLTTNGLTIGLAGNDIGGGIRSIGARISLAQPFPLITGGVNISLEADARWIHPPGGGALPDGIVVNALNVGPAAGAFVFAPSISVNGLGLRFAKNSEPLVKFGGVSLGSLGLHLFAQIGSAPLAGGFDLELADLEVGVAGTQGGNPVAQGMLNDVGGQGSSRLAPRFNPALSVQKHGSGPVLVSLRAGNPPGPWWLAIQRGFGPLYIEQVGFGVTVEQGQLQRISLLLDGRVSLLGLTAAVDDLQLTFVVASNASIFDSSRWAVDLAGLAISSDMGGITIQGGLRKFGADETVQYVGMLMGRFAVYGLSVFGGYGHGIQNGERYSSFFAFGAVNGPIGGPPAFFVTGIGGGLGINRDLVVPTDLSSFNNYPFIKALDPAAQPSPDPMAELTALSTYFPQVRGSFWFAAGLSFTSFALVDGVAVVSVQIGDGFQIAIFGLARMALPRPQAALVSIELGLVARFSSKEGVIWVQAQLTANSYLLYRDVRLTGGFAFVSWFKGPNKGQFVLTMGGYHSSFHRDGYPDVPRLGVVWSVSSAISVKGESYFALTSEALMAGARLDISADFGAAWAQVTFGADGIVYFDPFHFRVDAYASISAGVTIDFWLGSVSYSISIGARIMVEGPDFHGRAEFDVGPISLSVEFGSSAQQPHPVLPWSDFVVKYLEEASPGVARVLTALPGKGALPAGTGPGGPTDTGTADGSAAKPFTVFAEFELMVTSTVPVNTLTLGTASFAGNPNFLLGIAPMRINNANTNVRLNLVGPDGDATSRLGHELSRGPGFPIGVWGPPQNDQNPKVPAGDVIDAVDGVLLWAVATVPAGLPPIDYTRVETGPRRPLPFIHEIHGLPDLLIEAADLHALLPEAASDAEVFDLSGGWMARAGIGRTAQAALVRERSAPPRLGSLTDGLAKATAAEPEIKLPDAIPVSAVDTRVHPPVVIAVLHAPAVAHEAPPVRTTLSRSAAITVPPPTLQSVAAKMDPSFPAKLHKISGVAGGVRRSTIVASGAVPLTRFARGAAAAVAGRGAVGDAQERLAKMTAAFNSTQAAEEAATVLAGEVVVLQMPNAVRDTSSTQGRPRLGVSGGATRIVALGHGGEVLADQILREASAKRRGLPIPQGVERLAVAGAADAAETAPGVFGWHSGSSLPYIGWSVALTAGGTVRAEGAAIRSNRHRRTAGWISAAELVADASIVVTEFREPVGVIVIALDEHSGAEAKRNLSFGLSGAVRLTASDGTARAPQGIVSSNRTLLLYEIVPDKAGPVTVTVAKEEAWHLAGVMATAASIAEVTDLFATRGLDYAVRDAMAGATGERTLRWLQPASFRDLISTRTQTERAPKKPKRR